MERMINNKQIFIEEEHHHVLQHWIEYNRQTSSSPLVITLDYHTDTKPAFHRYACRELGNNNSKIIEFRENTLENTNLENFDFIDNLQNDEHIDFAIRKNIVSKVYIRSFQGRYDGRQDSCNEKIYHINSHCYSGCSKTVHDDDCNLIYCNRCIESEELIRQFTYISEINEDGFIRDNYILDIDLDFFRTIKSIDPDDASTFYRLIRGASIITIATEPLYVNEVKFDKEINSEYLLKRLLEHIEQATSQS